MTEAFCASCRRVVSVDEDDKDPFCPVCLFPLVPLGRMLRRALAETPPGEQEDAPSAPRPTE